MSDAITFTVDASGFHAALADYLRLSRRDITIVMRQQMRLLVERIMALTPPGGPGVTGTAARTRGEGTLRADMYRIFRPMSREALAAFVQFNGGRSAKSAFAHEGAASIGEVEERLLQLHEMAAWHNSRRRADGRVMRVNRTVTTGLRKRDMRGLDQGYVTRYDFETYYKIRARKIGYLAAGWVPALRSLGGTAPGWIARHSTPGRLEIHDTGSEINVAVINAAAYAGNVRGLQSRVAWAARLQEQSITRQIDHALSAAARATGLA